MLKKRVAHYSITLLLPALLIVMSLTPYYLLGDDSAIGWYDEFDLPISTSLLSNNNNIEFSPLVAGGSILKDNFFQFNNYFNLYDNLLSLLGDKNGTLSFRFIGITLIYLASIKILFFLHKNAKTNAHNKKNTNNLTITVVALIILFHDKIYFGWILGGYGYSPFIMLFTSYLLIVKDYLWKKVIFIIALAIFSSATAGSSVITIISTVLFSTITVTTWKKPNFLEYITLISIFIFSLIFMSLPELYSIYELKKESARLLGFTSYNPIVKNFNLSELLAKFFFDLYTAWFSNGNLIIKYPGVSIPSVGSISIIMMIYGIIMIKYKYIIKIITILLPMFVLYTLTETPLLLGFRADQIYSFLYPLLIFFHYEIHISSINEETWKKNISIIFMVALACTTLLSSYKIFYESWGEIIAGNTWKTIHLKVNKPIDNDKYRFYSETPYQPKPEILQLWGFRTIDGMRPTFTKLRTAFWHTVVPESPIDNFHTHRQTSFTFYMNGTKTRDSALEMMNVKYVVGSKHQEDKDEILTKQYDHCDIGTICSWINNKRKELSNIIYIRKLPYPWDYVFTPSNIKTSGYQELSKNYMLELRNLRRHEVLIPIELNKLNEIENKNNNITFNFNFTNSGVIIHPSKPISNQLLIINQEFTRKMKAECSGKRLNIFPINGVMTVIVVDRSCEHLLVTYTTSIL